MERHRPTDPAENAASGSSSGRRVAKAEIPPEPGPEHDPTTSREAYEREMAERGRSQEAERHGDHID